jgi:hypothetical protein
MFCQKTRHQSYAKVADDDSLRQLADRIQARAVRRMGELLKQFDGRGDHRKNGGAPTSSQREVAEQAGISKDQQVQAVRVANVPAVAITNVIGASTNVIETAEKCGSKFGKRLHTLQENENAKYYNPPSRRLYAPLRPGTGALWI